ncbi:manganese efflux pump MntP family protein [Aquibacillus sp. 3ASR75-11]|uniref:Putative manganese efflux pump MntP n=1 Tax=Terrihalobacillus insolitus TaxID=2950438 RepID=A0A9X3WS75_9BACI|nr:manganese efflux pump MntP family protein [Terrihalobacillus insolitus]MDC3411784.1 manganese efflux pump MntP family protein [Terrihalobacillus insolitus]MDC3425037.1 manganese efflux pump MntP family protein [Terrihalobacillus insolitus]
MPDAVLGEFISLSFMAIALGADAFSVGLGIGMQWLRLKRIFVIGLTVGLFHVMMPFLGIVIGHYISSQLEGFAIIAGGALLFGIGMQMLLSSFNREEQKWLHPTGTGLVLFALSVSIDSFSVGLSLGMSGTKVFLALLLFGLAATGLTWLGLLIGRKANGLLGVYSEIFGGSILCAFGLKLIFG